MSHTPPPREPTDKDATHKLRREHDALSGHHDPETDIEALPQPEGPTSIIHTEYEIGQDNIERGKPVAFDIHNPVFMISAVAIVLFTAATLMFPTVLGPFFASLRDIVTSRFDWFFIIAGNIFVLISLGLILSPLGSVRLGGPKATPDFTLTGWFSMLFAAGMGIGLMFYGVSEPLGHFTAALGGPVVENGVRTDWAPLGGAVGDELAARRLAMAATIFHWGLHPWAIYAVVALALALYLFCQYRNHCRKLFRLRKGLHQAQCQSRICNSCDGKTGAANGHSHFILAVGQADALLIRTGSIAFSSAPGMVGSIPGHHDQMGMQGSCRCTDGFFT